jgi:DNA polymerase I
MWSTTRNSRGNMSLSTMRISRPTTPGTTQLVRAVESVLSPLGWDRTKSRREIGETQEMNLSAFTEIDEV